MKTTRLVFRMFYIDGEYEVFPDSMIIIGTIFDWKLLNEFLFENKDGKLSNIVENIEEGRMYEIVLDYWIENEEGQSWLDFKVIKTELI